MRAWEDLTYQEYKEDIRENMRRFLKEGWSVERVIDYIVEENSDAYLFVGTSTALWIISVGAYEVEHDILEDRVLIQLSYHIPRFHMGKYTDDLTEEEYEQVAEDIKFIESKVKLYKLESYEDDEVDEEERRQAAIYVQRMKVRIASSGLDTYEDDEE